MRKNLMKKYILSFLLSFSIGLIAFTLRENKLLAIMGFFLLGIWQGIVYKEIFKN